MNVTIINTRFVLLADEPRVGGTASVYRATDISNGQTVAVKLFNSLNVDEEFIRESFLRETESLTILNRHPNIVQMLESGYDDNLKKFYIVLEWIDNTLTKHLKSIPTTTEYTWDAMAEDIVLPVLKGLAFAHERNVRHRDIKPSNILVTSNGTPKLADFGIAKIVDSLRLGMTVNLYGSKPFAAPEPVEKQSFNADLYSLGMTIIQLISLLKPSDATTTDLPVSQFLEHLQLPISGQKFISRLLAKDPQQRPLTASVALAELERILSNRSDLERPKFYLFFPKRKAEELAQLLDCHDNWELKQAVLNDLAEGAAIRQPPITTRDQASLNDYFLVGQEISYRVKVDETAGATLVVLSFITHLSYSQIERDRENSLAIKGEFIFGDPPSQIKAREVLTELMHNVAEFAQQLKLNAWEEEARRTFRRWDNILQAMTDLEATRQNSLGYKSVKIEDDFVEFEMSEPQDEMLIGQVRRIATNTYLVGTILDVAGTRLKFALSKGFPRQIPKIGYLIIDQIASESAITRQRKALQQVQHGTSARPDLGTLLIHPDRTEEPIAGSSFIPLSPELDDAKVNAINLALSSPDIALVQGPPGTGKTTWIAELVCQFIKQYPDKTVLLSAQTHTALDNALAKIEKLQPELNLLRIGSEEKISGGMEKYRIDRRIIEWGNQVRTNSDRYLHSWAKEHGISQEHLDTQSKIDALLVALTVEGDAARQVNLVRESILSDTGEATSTAIIEHLHPAPRPDISNFRHSARFYLNLSRKLLERVSDTYNQVDLTVLESLMNAQILSFTSSLPDSNDIERADLADEEGQTSSLESLAEEIFDLTDSLDAAFRNRDILSPSSPIKSLADRYIDQGLSLASEAGSLTESILADEAQSELVEARKKLQSASQQVEEMRIDLADRTAEMTFLDGTLADIEAISLSTNMTGSSNYVRQFSRLQAVQREWLLRFGRGEGFQAALLSMSQVVAGTCVGIASINRLADITYDLVIIDEASKATPTEALIAMSQGLKWVLVGDDKQLPPFVDAALSAQGHLEKYDLSRLDVENTLFDRLLEQLPSKCKAYLSVQHRMVPAIGDLISSCFYDKRLKSSRHPGMGEALSRLLDYPVTWKSTSRLDRRRETVHPARFNSGQSFSNIEEASRIQRWLEALETCARTTNEYINVGVISGYKPQMESLVRTLTPADRERWQALTLEINSVDAFQGREVDVLIYSITRSNANGDLGFLTSDARLNVALSRGRDALLIFGDAIHCQDCTKLENPFRKVLQYIEDNPRSCIVETLE